MNNSGCFQAKKPSRASFAKKKAEHMKSCMQYDYKKHLAEPLSESISNNNNNNGYYNQKRKRCNSSSGMIKNDKLVSKILNMSLLCSDLGGSQLVSSGRNQNCNSTVKTFK